jgi:membrane protein implicated in regulation of membrane protease activity
LVGAPQLTLALRQAEAIANIVFSICAALASLLVAVLSAVKGAPAVAVVFSLLFVGFLLRAREGHRRQQN